MCLESKHTICFMANSHIIINFLIRLAISLLLPSHIWSGNGSWRLHYASLSAITQGYLCITGPALPLNDLYPCYVIDTSYLTALPQEKNYVQTLAQEKTKQEKVQSGGISNVNISAINNISPAREIKGFADLRVYF